MAQPVALLMQDLGKLLVALGAIAIIAGLLLWSGIGRGWLGRLPGDIHVDKPGFSFHFPIVTCLLISLVLSAILWLLKK